MSRRVSLALLVTAATATAVPLSGAHASEGAAPGIALVPMTDLVVPIVEGARASGRLRVKLVLRAKDAEAAVRLTASMAKLRETAFLTTAEFARLYVSPMMPVDASRLATALNAALRARDAGVEAVLLVEISAARA